MKLNKRTLEYVFEKVAKEKHKAYCRANGRNNQWRKVEVDPEERKEAMYQNWAYSDLFEWLADQFDVEVGK
jgi:hypothetical protein